MFDRRVLFLLVVCTTCALACNPAESDPALTETPDSPLAAEFAGKTITLAELDDRIKEELFQQETRDGAPGDLYEARDEALTRFIDQTLLEAAAGERGLDVEGLLEAEASKGGPVSDEDVRAYYEEHKERLPAEEFDVLSTQIREHLQRERGREIARALVLSLRENANVVKHLEPPRLEVAASGPSKGPANAQVTIVEFSDYQCPYCKHVEPIVAQLLERYPQQVRFVFRHFPLDRIHPRARAAAEAASCAEGQGRFWQYHAALFENAPEFSDDDLEKYAETAELDVEAFRGCFGERLFQARVQADATAAAAAGVSGTPSFFVNGIPMSGSRTVEGFSKLIDSEIARIAEESGAS